MAEGLGDPGEDHGGHRNPEPQGRAPGDPPLHPDVPDELDEDEDSRERHPLDLRSRGEGGGEGYLQVSPRVRRPKEGRHGRHHRERDHPVGGPRHQVADPEGSENEGEEGHARLHGEPVGPGLPERGPSPGEEQGEEDPRPEHHPGPP